jgi:quercetin dioxygenase-like cupin family protein
VVSIKCGVPYVFIKKSEVKADPMLARKNNGRKIAVNARYAPEQTPMVTPFWQVESDSKAPTLETGCGGLEISTFNEKTEHSRHVHNIGTDIYIQLEGRLTVRLDDREEVTLEPGDELSVLPGTVHEVLKSSVPFLTRVHCVNCHGLNDLLVVGPDGSWTPQSKLIKPSQA